MILSKVSQYAPVIVVRSIESKFCFTQYFGCNLSVFISIDNCPLLLGRSAIHYLWYQGRYGLCFLHAIFSVPANGHLKQKLHARHRLVARTNAGASLHEMKLEILNIIGRRPVRRAPQPSGKTLAGA